MTFWVIRGGKTAELEPYAVENNCVVIDWSELPDLRTFSSRDDIERAVSVLWPEKTDRGKLLAASQLWNFREGPKPEDLVALPRKGQAVVSIGTIVGGYEHHSNAPPGTQHRRSVKWLNLAFPRAALDQDIKFSMGSTLTVFQVKALNAEARVRRLLDQSVAVGAEPIVRAPSEDVDMADVARDQIIGMIATRFRGHELARLVEAVLKAQGFTTMLSPPGPDGGVDILAGRGALGLDPPKIAVQVKSGGSASEAPALRELQGVISRFGADFGLFVSWSGFTNVASREAQRDFFKLRLWSSKELIDAFLENYDRLDDDVRAEVPLRRVWALSSDEDE